MFEFARAIHKPLIHNSRLITRITSTTVQFQRPFHGTRPNKSAESLNVGHSRFLAEGSRSAKWHEGGNASGTNGMDNSDSDYDTLTEGKGKLSPTSSHLFKLIVPIDRLRRQSDDATANPPTVFLLHPSQPLSHIGRLVAASLAPDTPSITFRSTSPKGLTLNWSDSTDLGDFIRDAARAQEFELESKGNHETRTLKVEVPTFADRTRFLRRKLESIRNEIQSMETLKNRCEVEAHRGARKMAVGGLGMLVVYWGTVTRLTFWDLGWDVMEPVTYLSGLSMVIIGYMWFLYQGREVSYRSVLDRSISTRRQALYKSHGFDIERWVELIAEEKTLRKEINKIAEDYDERQWKAKEDERDKQEAQAQKELEELKSNSQRSAEN